MFYFYGYHIVTYQLTDICMLINLY
uniref:Uncharacterized protein n=1 Tax=Arundo donax TaxID=35708 RepID=A0A0A8ZMN1_ARUDO